MLLFFIILLVVFCLILFLKALSLVISEQAAGNREELSSYECGFEHHEVSRVPFSVRYFFLTLIFLLFDLEIVFMVFLPSVLLTHMSFLSLGACGIFLFVLFIGLIYEWTDGTLEWLD